MSAWDGSAVADALVALNPVSGAKSTITKTDAQGRFRFPEPTEPSAITVTSPRGVALFVKHVDAVSSAPLRLRLEETARGLTISGTLRVVGGPIPAGSRVSAALVSDDQGDIFHVDVVAGGRFSVVVPPGTYVLRSEAEQIILTEGRTSGGAGESRDLALPASLRAPAPDDVVAWLRTRAMPITTTTVGTPTDDLEPLARALDGARVIGLGEATHGTREFFWIKHRLLERLVEKHGVSVFVMEANVAEAAAVDAYLQTGRGDLDKVLQNLFLVWRTEEVRDLIAWMRRWNADPKRQPKLRFAGCDVQGAQRPIEQLRAYLRRVDPAGPDLLGPLAPIDKQTNTRGKVELTEKEASDTREAAARLVEHVRAKEHAWVARSGRPDYRQALLQAIVIQQAQALFSATNNKEQFTARDRGMADNVIWQLEQADPRARMVVWAHNGHLQLDDSRVPGVPMGMRLRERLGTSYVSVGFLMNQGSYRAAPDPSKPRQTIAAPVSPAGPGFAAEAFSRVGVPSYAIDLRTAPEGPVRDWLAAPHMLHSYGWIVPDARYQAHPYSLTSTFDVAIYVDQTTASRRLDAPAPAPAPAPAGAP